MLDRDPIPAAGDAAAAFSSSPPPAAPPRTAARALVEGLERRGVSHVFCVPGESYLPVLDALLDSTITVTVCRQEGGAAMMAEAVGKATGRPGVCFVTRGPGATNAACGVHVAHQDSTPMILFAGQVDRVWREREAWQELDYRAAFGGMTKWTTELDDPRRTDEYLGRAFNTASAGRPGPVVMALPRDTLGEAAGESVGGAPFAPLESSPGGPEMAALESLLRAAKRPIAILGGSRWSEEARSAMHRMAETWGIPVATSYRRGPLFDPLHPNAAGDLGLGANPKLVARVKAADLMLLIGGRLGEVPSQGYTLFDAARASEALVHVHPGAEELGRLYPPRLSIHSGPIRFVEALAALPPPAAPLWAEQAAAAHRDYLDWSEIPLPQPGAVNFGEVMVWLREHLPLDSILCNGAGNYAAWIHRYYRFRTLGSHIAPTSASMGYGVPAAVAMKRLYPERQVISIAGDGDFLMNGQEFATMIQYGLPVVNIVVDNGCYGSIRMHQEREFPGRVSATDLRNPDFAAYARAFGGFGATVERTADFADAFLACETSGLPSIVHLKVDPDAILPAQTLTQLRAQGMAKAAVR